MTLSPERELEFYRIQKEFFCCDKESLCLENLTSKVTVGDQEGWYYNPPSEYIGERYAGIVVVAAKPAMPVNPGLNPELRKKILAFLSSPTLEQGREMNRIVGGFINKFLFVRAGEADYLACGIEDFSRIAFMNIYKCRVREGGMEEITPPWILEPCVRGYLDRQMALLRPALIIYQWPFVYEALVRLKELDSIYDPGYGADVLVGPDNDDPESVRSDIYMKIREKIRSILIKEDPRIPGPVV